MTSQESDDSDCEFLELDSVTDNGLCEGSVPSGINSLLHGHIKNKGQLRYKNSDEVFKSPSDDKENFLHRPRVSCYIMWFIVNIKFI